MHCNLWINATFKINASELAFVFKVGASELTPTP
jgi:hypothetical protein